MSKLTMHTPNQADENYRRLAELFPEAVTEAIDPETGEVVRAIDKDVLTQLISTRVVEGREERYQFTWPDKRRAILTANAPITATLRPVRADSVGRDGTPGGFDSQNLYIEGDNLDVLKLLHETYLHKVKMIYIDPPYNTGNDFVYEDDFAEDAAEYIGHSGQYDEQGNRLVQNIESNGRFHTDWLNMIYPRLRIAKDLLAKDGVLAISIGYQEVHKLMLLCEQLFSNMQIMSISVQTSGGKPNGGFNISHEHIIFVVPHDYVPIPSEEDMREYASPYHGMNLATFSQIERPNQAYPIFVDSKGRIVSCGKTLQERVDSGEYIGEIGDYVYDYSIGSNELFPIWPVTRKGEQCVWRLIPSRLLRDWRMGYIKVVPVNGATTQNKFTIQYLSAGIIEKIESGELETYRISEDAGIPTIEVRDYKTAGAGISTMWTDTSFYTTRGSNEIREIFTKKCFSYPKPLDMLYYIAKRTTTGDDTVLDFFSGSATMAHAVMKLNSEDKQRRRYIMVQLPEKCEAISDAYRAGFCNICEIGKERIRRAGRKIKEDAGITAPDLDIGFRVLRLDSSNMEDIYYTPDKLLQSQLDLLSDNIKPDRTPEDLLFQVMLEMGVGLSSVITETVIDGKRVFDVADGYMLACFDNNVTTETVTTIAKRKPYFAVFRDSGFANDSVVTNFEQIFRTYSKDTTWAVI